jgi:hypothetical protein
MNATNSTAVLLASVLLTSPAARPLIAHHSVPVNYDQSREITIEGVLTEIKWLNPHATFRLNVTGPDGSVVEWLVEMGAANTMKRAGFPMERFVVGDRITVIGNPGRRDRAVLLNETVLKDGTRMNPAMRPPRAGGAGDAG